MELKKGNLKIFIVYCAFYVLGLFLLFFWGEFYFELILGYGLTLLGYFYIVYYIKKNDLNNKFLTSFFFICLLFFWVRAPFVFKSSLLTPDFYDFYDGALSFVRGQIPLIRFGGYGAVFYFFTFIPALLTGGDFFIMKFVFVLLDFGNLIMIYLITNELNYENNYKICLLYSLLPLSIIEFAWNAHNETGMLLFMLLSLYFMLKKKNIINTALSGIFLILAIAYKYFAFVIFPLYLIYYYKKRETKFEFIKTLIFFLGPTILVAGYILVFHNGLIVSLLNSLTSHFTRIPINNLLATLNYHIQIGGLAGFLFGDAMNFGVLEPLIILLGVDLLSLSIIGNLSWLILGVLLIITFRKKMNDPLYASLSITPIGVFILSFIVNYQISYFFQQILNLGVLLAILVLFYIFVYRLQNYEKEDLLHSQIYAIMIFLTIYWVVYGWYYFWVIPFIFILLNKFKQGNYLIVALSMFAFSLTMQRFTNIFMLEVNLIILGVYLTGLIILFWKGLELSSKVYGSEFSYSKYDKYLPRFLNFDMKQVNLDQKPYSEMLLILFTISLINSIILTLFFMIFLPKILIIDPILVFHALLV
ncbi:MAG: hypothetical protein ACTSRG_00040 [Candidatus Helarchaeota archaeon]